MEVVMKAILLAILVLFFSIGNRAEAGVLLEPYLGYQALVTDITLGAAATPLDGTVLKLATNGLGFGVRVGFALPVVFFALDYSSASGKMTVSEPANFTITPDEFSRTALGVTVGASLKVVRPYVGYIFDDQSKSGNTTFSGTGFKVGVGFSIIPKLSLNAEYVTSTFTKAKDSAGTEITLGDAEFYKSMKASGFFVSVSAPFEF
jgi:hypothetical protein